MLGQAGKQPEGAAMPAMDKVLTVEEMMLLARRRVPRMFFDYADSGSYTESTFVCPGILPPIISTTPNSPTVWAKVITAPVM